MLQDIVARTVKRSKLWPKLIGEAEGEQDRARAEQAEALATIRADRSAGIPLAAAALERAKAEQEKALAQLGAINGRVMAADAELRRATTAGAGHEERLLRALRSLAPPELSRFAKWCQSLAAAVGALPDPWGPQRDDRLALLDYLRESDSWAASEAEAATPLPDLRKAMTRRIQEARAQFKAAGDLLGAWAEGDPLEAPEDHGSGNGRAA
jgi:hypothetical protein